MEQKTFSPKKRLLVDALLILNSLFFILAVFKTLTFDQMIQLAGVLSVTAVILWFVIVVPLTKAQFKDNALIGRTPSLGKKAIPLRKVHHIKTNSPLPGLKRKFFKDIWSVDDERIRLHRKFLGESQINEIMLTIEKYPFRAGTAPQVPPAPAA